MTAGSPALRPNADILRRVTVEAIRRYAPNTTLTLSMAIVPGANAALALRDASNRGYWDIESSGISSSTSHTVPLLGGFTAAEVGFVPTVSATGGTIGVAPGTAVYPRGTMFTGGPGSLAIRYVIADAGGNVVESRTIPLADSRFVPGSLEDYRDAGAYIARRMAKH
ncbi:MAG TPA: hypothetical protein VI258_01925 [Rhodanobacteraceae bacterium]